MSKQNPRVHACIVRAQPCARPIFKKVGTLLHKVCPAVET